MPLIRSKAAAPASPPQDDAQIAAAMRDSSIEGRWAAARAAATLPSGLVIMSDALPKETSSRVREAIFTALARIGTSASAAAVVPYLRSDDPEIRTGALDALRAMPDGAAAHLSDLLRDDDADVRLLACELVRNQPADAANTMLCALLSAEREANVCAAAIEVLAETGDARALPALQDCAARFPDDPFLAFAISLAIDRIGSQASSRG